MKTLNDIQNVNSNAANVASNNNKINDFGQKIGGARKDLYQAAHEWAAQLADITADALTKAGGVSKLIRLPNLEKLTEAGAITADQARAALIIWRGIERKPQGSYRADRWAERTRHRLEAAAAVITATEPQGEDVADIIRAARESAEFAVISAAEWPAVAFSFGKYAVIRCRYSNIPKLQIQDARYYRGTASEDPADIARQLREMVADDEAKAADRRAAGPALGVYMNRAGVYYIAPADRSEIVLQTYEDRAAALKAYRENRAALVERYAALKNFPACRRDWNRPRVGEDWRKGENMTPEKYAAVLPFRGVEFGNWVNQTERAALLNSAFDGFHDLAAVLNIAPAAVTLNGSLAFAFASRGHSGAAAHYEPARRVINLTKKSGAGCMAHEWFHAVDNFAAGGGIHNYATERRDHPAAFAILEAIKRTDYYRRSQNLARFKGDYWTEGRELTARAFEGVAAVMLNAAGICSDFLVNCKSMDEFTAEDVASRSDYYPYPTADEAAALLPLYVDFLREVFGDVLTAPAACYEEAKRAAARAELQRQEAERIAAERAEAERQERERKAKERAEQAAREAEARKQAAAHALELLRDVLTARHLDAIATAYDTANAYAVAHLEGEIYTLRADIKTADQEGRPYVAQLPAACIHYKRVHNAKRIICRRYQVPEIRAAKWNARELCEGLAMVDVREICRAFESFEKGETWQKAATLWADTQRLHEAQSRRASEATEKPATGTKAAEGTDTKPATADGLTMEKYSEKATVIRGYNADQLAELLAIGGKEWRNLRGGKGVIFSTRRHGDELREWMKAQQGEGVPAAAESNEAAPATLEAAQDITAPASEEPAAPAGLPEWLKVGARVRTRGRYMMSNHSHRPVWVEGEEMTVKEIKADFVELETRDEAGNLRGLSSVATSAAADYLTPVLYEASEITATAEAEPEAIAASYDTDETADASEEPAATYETTATDDERQQADALPFMEKAAILDKITARIYAPWGDVSKMWLCPFRGAYDVWNAWARGLNLRDFGRLAEWALTAKAGERAELCGLMVQIWERDGQTATEPESEADRLTANRETRERLRAAIVAELETVGAYIYPFNNEMKVFGKIQTAAELSKVEDIARRYSSAQFRHEDRAAVFEFNLPLFFPHFFPTDPAPEPSGEGETEAAPRYSNGEKSERTKTRGQVFAQYFRILHQLTDGKTWESETNRDRAARILDALNRYKDNFAKVPEIARLFASVTERTDDGRDPVEVLNAIPVRRSVYMGIEKPRRKSMSDICGQAADILREIYNAGRSESNSRRYNRVEAIQERYLTNIAQSLGYPSYHEFTGISSKTRYETKERKAVDRDYYLKMDRETYAAPFDVDRIRKAETWEELNPLRNSLYYQNVRPCEGCPFSASTNFCPYTGGATVEQCKERILSVIAPAPEPSGDGAGICHSFDTNQDTATLQEAGEITAPAADPLADIISEARKQESRTASGLNYGPIKYLRCHVLYADNGKTTAENMDVYEANLHRVTDPDTYAAYLLSSYDLFVDETQVYCDLRRVFPALTFHQLCKLINDHMGENQQGDGIAAGLVPDCVILASPDEYTREKFRERHERFYKLSSYWHGDQVNTNRESDLKKHYDRESLAVHFLLSHELYYTWSEDRAAECLARVRDIYPETTAEQLRDIFDKYRVNVRNLYE
jgi:hypothetical protein